VHRQQTQQQVKQVQHLNQVHRLRQPQVPHQHQPQVLLYQSQQHQEHQHQPQALRQPHQEQHLSPAHQELAQ
jgi:hypothetical protein